MIKTIILAGLMTLALTTPASASTGEEALLTQAMTDTGKHAGLMQSGGSAKDQVSFTNTVLKVLGPVSDYSDECKPYAIFVTTAVTAWRDAMAAVDALDQEQAIGKMLVAISLFSYYAEPQSLALDAAESCAKGL